MHRPICLVLAFVFIPIAYSSAQETVERGSRIRYTECTPACNDRIGTLVGLGQGNTSVVLHQGEAIGIVQVPFASITRLQVSRGQARDKLMGAVVGGVVGGGVGVLFMRSAGDPCDSDSGLFCGLSGGTRIGSIAVAASVGAVAGAFAAPSRERWEVISPQQISPDAVIGAMDVFSLGLAVKF